MLNSKLRIKITKKLFSAFSERNFSQPLLPSTQESLDAVIENLQITVLDPESGKLEIDGLKFLQLVQLVGNEQGQSQQKFEPVTITSV